MKKNRVNFFGWTKIITWLQNHERNSMSHSAKKQKWVNYVKKWQSYSGRNDNCHIPQKIATFNCNISPKMWHSIVTFRSAKCYNQLSHFCAKCDNWMSHFSRNVTIDISRRNMIVIFTHKIYSQIENWLYLSVLQTK